jgi:RNA recognition motif-containing protein
MKSRLQTIFVFQDFGDDSINYSETGNLEYILYTFNLHIGICSDMRNEIQMGKPITLSNASNWWLSAKSLLYQIYNTFKLQNTFISKSNSQSTNINSININRIPSTKREDILDIYGMKKKDELINGDMNINKDDLLGTETVSSISRSNSCMPSLSSPASTTNSSNGPIQPSTNIYIRNLPSNTTDDSLYQMCKQYGTIVSAKAMIDIRTNECKGFGFVMYETEEQARKAIDALNKLKYYVSFARSGTPSSQESYSSRLKNLEDNTSMNIYISNLPVDVDEKQLLNLFKPHKVLSHRILRNEDGVSRGVGFARFSTRAAAQSVIDTYNNTMLPNSEHPLQVRFADSVAQKRLKSQIAIVNGNRHRSGSVSSTDLSKHTPSPQQQPQLNQTSMNQLNLMK